MRFTRLRAQRGVALIALLAVIALGASWYLVSALNDNTANRLALQRAQNAKVLEQAKRALLGWAALNAADTTDINPGRLPCPEDTANYYNANTEGTAATTCPTGTVIGRLPWRTLGIPKMLDASGEPLWYVVSNGWKLTAASTAMGINSNSAGQLALGTQTPAALIIAPGPAITVAPTAAQIAAGCTSRTQNRNITSPTLPDYRDYLECENATNPVDATFVTSVIDNGPNTVLNDQLVGVSSAEVMNAVEGSVAKRIATTVVPKLQETYVTNASQWGATTANPVFPFAATFADPSGSTFKGVIGTPQGLLPMTGSACTGLMSTHCDSAFIQWSGTPVVTKNSGTGNISASCSSSTATDIKCDIVISGTCNGVVGALLGDACPLTFNPNVTITATTQNAGRALRAISSSSVSATLTSPSIVATLDAAGSSSTATTGTINSTGVCNLDTVINLVQGLFSCTASSAPVQITIPIGVFQDHPLNTAVSTDPWYWFTANRWYDVTYYAVAASHTPSGGHNCTIAGDCITVTNGTPASSIRAVLALAGRSLNGTTGSNRALTDFLDSTENQNGDRAFEQKTISYSKGSQFNDRFVTVSNY